MTAPLNPLALLTLYDTQLVAADMVRLWRSGSRHPRLARQLQDVWPGLPLATHNEAADLAWSMLTMEERQAAAEEA